MTLSYTDNGDAMPDKRLKVVHSIGAIGKVHWIPNKNAAGLITGVLAEPTSTALFRFAAPIKPVANEDPHRSTSWKFLRDGMGSGNIVANMVDVMPN